MRTATISASINRRSENVAIEAAIVSKFDLSDRHPSTLSVVPTCVKGIPTYRNSWKGHGGLMKASDAVRLESELQQSLREFYEITAAIFRHLQLVRPGAAEYTDAGFRTQIEKLIGRFRHSRSICPHEIEGTKPTLVGSSWAAASATKR
jgi:transketolase